MGPGEDESRKETGRCGGLRWPTTGGGSMSTPTCRRCPRVPRRPELHLLTDDAEVQHVDELAGTTAQPVAAHPGLDPLAIDGGAVFHLAFASGGFGGSLALSRWAMAMSTCGLMKH